jgi:hypothetical protein
MNFRQWLEQHGCTVEVTQADDGSGYEVWTVRTQDGWRFDGVTVQTAGAS